jgi:hypothetical protein
MAPDAGVRTLRDDARNAAGQIQRFTNEMKIARFAAKKFMCSRRLYRSDHLPTVVRIRDAFADLGIRDPELDR